MSKTIYHTPRRLSSAQRAFLRSQVDGKVVNAGLLKSLPRLFKERFGVGIDRMAISRLVQKDRNGRKDHNGHLAKTKSAGGRTLRLRRN